MRALLGTIPLNFLEQTVAKKNKPSKIKSRSTGWAALQIGDIVDVVAPGFSISKENLEAAKKFLVDLGLKPRVPDDIFGPDILCAQTDQKREQQLKAALLAKDSKAIWCLRGGYGAIRLIDGLRKMKAPPKPKIFVGYSDATTLHNFLNHFWGWPTLHGPLLDRLGQHTLPLEQVNEALDIVFGRVDHLVHGDLEPLNSAAQRKQVLRGRVYGGNLTVTQSHLGTEFGKVPKDAIFVFEDIGERGYRVDRILKQFSQANYFKSAKAVIFGDFVGGEERDGTERVSAVIERFAKESPFAVFRGLKVGHGERQRMVPLHTPCELRCGAHGVLTSATGIAEEANRPRRSQVRKAK